MTYSGSGSGSGPSFRSRLRESGDLDMRLCFYVVLLPYLLEYREPCYCCWLIGFVGLD